MSERRFKETGEKRTDCASSYGYQQPRETITESPPGRGAANLREMKAERLEKITAHFFVPDFLALKNALQKDVRIHDSDHTPLRVHNWKCEKFVEHKKFACLQNSRFSRQSDHPVHHDVAQESARNRREQSACRNNADQPLAFIDRVKVNDAFADSFASNGSQRFLDAGLRFEQREISPRVIESRRIQIDRAGNHHRCTLCTIPLFRKIRAASLK